MKTLTGNAKPIQSKQPNTTPYIKQIKAWSKETTEIRTNETFVD